MKLDIGYHSLLLYQDLMASDDAIIRLGLYSDEGYTAEPRCPDLEQSTLLKPVWNLKTDSDGYVVLPINKFYRQKEEVELTVRFNGKSKKIKANTKSREEVEVEF